MFGGLHSTVAGILAGDGRRGRPKQEKEVFEGCQVVSAGGPDGCRSHRGGKDGLAKW